MSLPECVRALGARTFRSGARSRPSASARLSSLPSHCLRPARPRSEESRIPLSLPATRAGCQSGTGAFPKTSAAAQVSPSCWNRGPACQELHPAVGLCEDIRRKGETFTPCPRVRTETPGNAWELRERWWMRPSWGAAVSHPEADLSAP